MPNRFWKSFFTGLVTTGLLIVSAGTAAPVLLASTVVGTSAGVAAYKNDNYQKGAIVEVKINDNGKVKITPDFIQ